LEGQKAIPIYLRWLRCVDSPLMLANPLSRFDVAHGRHDEGCC